MTEQQDEQLVMKVMETYPEKNLVKIVDTGLEALFFQQELDSVPEDDLAHFLDEWRALRDRHWPN